MRPLVPFLPRRPRRAMSMRTASYRDSAKEAQRQAIAQGGLTIKLMTVGLVAITAAHSYWMWHRQRCQSARTAQAAAHPPKAGPLAHGRPEPLTPARHLLGRRREPAPWLRCPSPSDPSAQPPLDAAPLPAQVTEEVPVAERRPNLRPQGPPARSQDPGGGSAPAAEGQGGGLEGGSSA